MISLELSPSHNTAPELRPGSGRQPFPANPLQHVFSDSHYLRHVIRLLRKERKRLGLDVQEVATRARLKEGVINSAEQKGVIPTCREFRAWAKSLGLQWEQLWTLAFPMADAN
jgi:ribosome-binding protein aMBF1 (putative translation factor)